MGFCKAKEGIRKVIIGSTILTLGKDKVRIRKAKVGIRQGKDGIRRSEPPNSLPREGWNPARRGKEFPRWEPAGAKVRIRR